MLKKLWGELGRRPRTPSRAAPAGDALGEVYAALGRGEFEPAASRLADLDPRDPALAPGACRLGEDRLGRGEEATAIDWFFRALSADPLSARARAGLGAAYLAAGDLEEAMLQLTLARRLRPGDAQSAVRQGQIQLAWGNLDLAAQALEEGLVLDPGQPFGWNDLGILRQRGGQLAEAARCFRRAVALDPAFATAHANFGLALRELERSDEARAALERAVALRPGSADNNVNLGTVLQDLGDSAGAEQCYERARALDGRHPEALLGLGTTCQRRGELAVAESWFVRALAARPGFAAARTALGEIRLARGEFGSGWADYESRLAAGAGHRLPIPLPDWTGEPMRAGTLLVYWEQGLGDIVLFASCVAEAAARVGRLVIEVPPALERLFARSFPEAVLSSRLRENPAAELERVGRVDAAVAVGSLMRIFRSAPGSFPRHRGYLAADHGRVAVWRERLRTLAAARVIALSWRGGLARTGRAQRSLGLEALRPALSVPDIAWVSVQYGAPGAELAELQAATGIRVHHWDEVAGDLDEVAALMTAAGGVLTVCNTNAHLAGALGVPVGVLAPQGVSWRYQATGRTIPWYPSATVFRQTRSGDWQAPIADVERALRAGAFPGPANAD